jgi:3-dehydroquinate dehydratase, type I
VAEEEQQSQFVWPPRLLEGCPVHPVREARPVQTVRIGRGDPAVALGGPTRIIVPVTGTDVDELRAQCLALQGHPVDLVEWRVDQLGAAGESVKHAVEEALAVVLQQAGLPVLATVRTVHEGGAADLGDPGYAEVVGLLARCGADAVDVEYRRADAESIIEGAHLAGAAVIASNHDFGGTPPEEEVISRLVAMRDLGADVAKVAYRAREPLDMFPVLNAQMWAREHLGIPVIAISMGMAGAITRVGGERLGSAATFATVGRGSAPGQLSAEAVAQALRESHRP